MLTNTTILIERRLSYEGILSPKFFRQPVNYTTRVNDNGRIELMDLVLWFTYPSQLLPSGEEVVVRMDRQGFFCILKEDFVAGELARRIVEERRNREDKERRNRLRDEAVAFNATIDLPVKWDVGIKDVLSGLSERRGDGRKMNTVQHILLLDSFERGKLRRSAGDFLCTAASGTNGQRYTPPVERFNDGDGDQYAPKVTCQRCLKLAGKS